MKIRFDQAGSASYPLDAKTAKQVVNRLAPPDVVEAIREIRFGCNRTTSQEARIVAKGSIFDIRINFCLVNGCSRALSSDKKWADPVVQLGGVIDASTNSVSWPGESAKRYALFLLIHELAHVIYARERGEARWSTPKSSTHEEAWCDEFALRESKAIDLE